MQPVRGDAVTAHCDWEITVNEHNPDSKRSMGTEDHSLCQPQPWLLLKLVGAASFHCSIPTGSPEPSDMHSMEITNDRLQQAGFERAEQPGKGHLLFSQLVWPSQSALLCLLVFSLQHWVSRKKGLFGFGFCQNCSSGAVEYTSLVAVLIPMDVE